MTAGVATFVVWGSVARVVMTGLFAGFSGIMLLVNRGPGFAIPIWLLVGAVFISTALLLPLQMWTDGKRIQARYLVRRKSLRVSELDEVRFGSSRSIRTPIKQPGWVLSFLRRNAVEFSVYTDMRKPVRAFVTALKLADPSLRVPPSALLVHERRTT